MNRFLTASKKGDRYDLKIFYDSLTAGRKKGASTATR